MKGAAFELGVFDDDGTRLDRSQWDGKPQEWIDSHSRLVRYGEQEIPQGGRLTPDGRLVPWDDWNSMFPSREFQKEEKTAEEDPLPQSLGYRMRNDVLFMLANGDEFAFAPEEQRDGLKNWCLQRAKLDGEDYETVRDRLYYSVYLSNVALKNARLSTIYNIADTYAVEKMKEGKGKNAAEAWRAFTDKFRIHKQGEGGWASAAKASGTQALGHVLNAGTAVLEGAYMAGNAVGAVDDETLEAFRQYTGDALGYLREKDMEYQQGAISDPDFWKSLWRPSSLNDLAKFLAIQTPRQILQVAEAAYMGPLASASFVGLESGYGKLAQLREENPEMSEEQRAVNALATGVINSGAQWLLSDIAAGKLFKFQPKVEKPFLKVAAYLAKSAASEAGQEAAEQAAENLLDIYTGERGDISQWTRKDYLENISDGVALSAIAGGFMGTMGSAVRMPGHRSALYTVFTEQRIANDTIADAQRIHADLHGRDRLTPAQANLLNAASDVLSRTYADNWQETFFLRKLALENAKAQYNESLTRAVDLASYLDPDYHLEAEPPAYAGLTDEGAKARARYEAHAAAIDFALAKKAPHDPADTFEAVKQVFQDVRIEGSSVSCDSGSTWESMPPEVKAIASSQGFGPGNLPRFVKSRDGGSLWINADSVTPSEARMICLQYMAEKGFRNLFGNRFDEVMESVYSSISRTEEAGQLVQEILGRDPGEDLVAVPKEVKSLVAQEFLARRAADGLEKLPGIVSRGVQAMRQLILGAKEFASAGLSDKDILTLVSRSLEAAKGGKGNPVELKAGQAKEAWDAVETVANGIGLEFTLATDQEWKAEMKKAASAKGIPLAEFERKYRVNGWYADGDRVMIAPGVSPRFAFAHEMGHWLKKSHADVWNALVSLANEALTETGKAGMEAEERRYQGIQTDVAEEFLCDRIAEAMENPALVRSFIRTLEARKAGLGKRVLYAIRDFLEYVLDFFSSNARKNPSFRNIDAFSREAGRILAGMESTEKAETGFRNALEKNAYSIGERADGKKYVKIDIDQHLFDGLSTEEIIHLSRKVILERYRNKVIGTFPHNAFVNRDSAEEYAYPAASRRMTDDVKEAKGRASTHLDELMEAARFMRPENDDGRHKDAVNGWELYSVEFELSPNEVYEGTINVRITKNGRVFHDMTHIKKIPAGLSGSVASAKGPIPNGDLGGTIAPKEQFSITSVAERRKDLIALHNLTEGNLISAGDMGGFPMPSIAVVKDSMEHSAYGPISLLFPSSSIDPKRNRKNRIYSGDAWTPTFPRIEYEADPDVESRIYRKSKEIRERFGEDAARPLFRYASCLDESLERQKGVSGLMDSLGKSVDMMKVFLLDTGKEIPKVPEGENSHLWEKEAVPRAVDRKEYREWLSRLFDGAEKSRGIRNGKDLFTYSGNRRPFSATHDPITLANAVRAMLREKEKGGILGTNPYAAATEMYKSLNDVIKDEGRLQILDDSKLSEIQEKKDAACGVIQEIANVLVSRRGVKGYGNPLLVYADAREAMLDAYAKGKGNPEKVLGEMNREGFYQATKEEIQRFCQTMKELRNLPTRYLEAKPARAVAFGEVAAAIVPGDISLEAMDVLQRNRVKAYTYRPGDAEDRLRAVNQAADENQGTRFSLSDAVPSKAGYAVDIQAAKAKVDDLLAGRISRKGGAKIDYRIQGESMETISRDAKRVIEEFSQKRIPLSTGKELYFAPDRRTIDAYGGDMATAWAEYALHLVTHRGKTKDGKVVRFFDEKNLSAILPNIQDIVNEDRVICTDNGRIVFYGKYSEGDSVRSSRYAKLVTEMDASGDLACDLRYITGMLQKGTLPGNTVSLEDASTVTLEKGAAERPTRGRVIPTPAGYSNVTPNKQLSITDLPGEYSPAPDGEPPRLISAAYSPLQQEQIVKMLKPVMDGEMGEDAEALGEYLEICGVKLARTEDVLYFARLARQELDQDAASDAKLRLEEAAKPGAKLTKEQIREVSRLLVPLVKDGKGEKEAKELLAQNGISATDKGVSAYLERAKEMARKGRKDPRRQKVREWLFGRTNFFRIMEQAGEYGKIVPSERFMGQEFSGSFIDPVWIRYSGKKFSSLSREQVKGRLRAAASAHPAFNSDVLAKMFVDAFGGDEVDVEEAMLAYFNGKTWQSFEEEMLEEGKLEEDQWRYLAETEYTAWLEKAMPEALAHVKAKRPLTCEMIQEEPDMARLVLELYTGQEEKPLSSGFPYPEMTDSELQGFHYAVLHGMRKDAVAFAMAYGEAARTRVPGDNRSLETRAVEIMSRNAMKAKNAELRKEIGAQKKRISSMEDEAETARKMLESAKEQIRQGDMERLRQVRELRTQIDFLQRPGFGFTEEQQEKIRQMAESVLSGMPEGMARETISRILQLGSLPVHGTKEDPRSRRTALEEILSDVAREEKRQAVESIKQGLLERTRRWRTRTTRKGIPVGFAAEGQAKIDRIAAILRMGQETVEALVSETASVMAGLDEGEAGTTGRVFNSRPMTRSELMEDIHLLQTFSFPKETTPEQAKAALEEFDQILEKGRSQYDEMISRRLDENKRAGAEIKTALNGTRDIVGRGAAQGNDGEKLANPLLLHSMDALSLLYHLSGTSVDDFRNTWLGRAWERVEDAAYKESEDSAKATRAFNEAVSLLTGNSSRSSLARFWADSKKEMPTGASITQYYAKVGPDQSPTRYLEDGRRSAVRIKTTVETARKLLEKYDAGLQPTISDPDNGIVTIHEMNAEFLRRQLSDYDARVETTFEPFTDERLNQEFRQQMETARANGEVYLLYSSPKEQSRQVPLTMSKGQALQAILTWEQPDAQMIMRWNGWSDETIDALRKFVGKEILAVGDWMRQSLLEMRDDLDAVAFRRYGAHLPNVENYFPTRYATATRAGNDTSATRDTPKSLATGFLVQRRFHLRPLDLKADAFETYLGAVGDQIHYVTHAEVMADMRDVLMAPDVKDAIVNRYSRNFLHELQDRLRVIEGGGRNGDVVPLVSTVMRVYVNKALAFNVVSSMKQAFSSFAYMNRVPVSDFFKNIARIGGGEYRAWAKEAWNSEYMKSRMGGGYDANISYLRTHTESGKAGQFANRLASAGYSFLAYGDAISVMTGGWAVWKYNYDQAKASGLGEPEARKKAWRAWMAATDTTQQGSYAKDLNYWQSSKGMGRLFSMFMNNPMQVLNNEYREFLVAAQEYKTGNKKKAARRALRQAAVNHFLIPTLMLFVADMFKAGFIPDDWWEDTDMEDYIVAWLMGPFEAVPVIGSALSSASTAFFRWISGKPQAPQFVGRDAMDVASQLGQDMKALSDGDLSEKDAEAITDMAAAAATSLAAFSPTTGEPLADIASLANAAVRQANRAAETAGVKEKKTKKK